MASIQHTITLNWSSGSNSLQNSVTLTGQLEVNVGILVPGSTVNQQITNFAFTKTKLQDIYIVSDQALTIYTNATAGGSPQDTLTLTANDPLVWYTGSGIANPFGGNVTTAYVSVPGATSANLSIKSLDVSP